MNGGEREAGVAIEDLGRAGFAATHAAMRELVESIRRGATPGKVLLVEHEGVYTAGRAIADAERPAFAIPVERGGRITWHGPGQLVVYPVVPLLRRDVRAWLTALEAFGVAVCAQFGLTATPSVDGTGVFVGAKKVASIGVAIRHWVSMHGISINVSSGPEPWQRIRPCGLSPDAMSDLQTELGRPLAIDAVRAAVRAALPELLAAAGQAPGRIESARARRYDPRSP
ncbi:MAG: lipoyl(octanoyl) transferase LipB [Planctomycetes bacterium]|nr:lipoyl(octanoyl) transferase LipB [Planctomycetota bacterium]